MRMKAPAEWALALVASLALPVLIGAAAGGPQSTDPVAPPPVAVAEHPTAEQQRKAATAFEAMMPVLHHPRCMNCHMSGDFPRQGDDEHPHIMDVRRGPDGRGLAPVRCSTCHRDHNLPGLHVPPGAPDWRLPPPAMPMVWEHLSDHQLCTLFKDPQQNGHRSLPQLVDHMYTPLVLWGWHPGEGRTPIPNSQAQFLAEVKVWVANGGGCPAQ